MKQDVRQDDEAVASHIGIALVVGLTVMVAAVVGAQAIKMGNSQPTFAHGGVAMDSDGNSVEVVYLADAGQADYIEVTFSDGSATGTARLHAPGTKATLSRGTINTTGDAEVVRQHGSLGGDVRVTAVAFNSNNGATSSTLVYRGCTGRCPGSGSELVCIEDEDAGHGNNCDRYDPDNPGTDK